MVMETTPRMGPRLDRKNKRQGRRVGSAWTVSRRHFFLIVGWLSCTSNGDKRRRADVASVIWIGHI